MRSLNLFIEPIRWVLVLEWRYILVVRRLAPRRPSGYCAKVARALELAEDEMSLLFWTTELMDEPRPEPTSVAHAKKSPFTPARALLAETVFLTVERFWTPLLEKSGLKERFLLVISAMMALALTQPLLVKKR